MPINAWFPTFIYESALPRPGRLALLRELLEESYKVREIDTEGRAWSARNYAGGYTSYGSMNRLHKMLPSFEKLERALASRVRTFSRRLDMDLGHGRLEMSDCWVSIMPRHVGHGLHFHPLSIFSGACYLKAPRGCSRISFEDPRFDRFMAAPPRRADARPENRPQVHCEIEPGKIVLFESWLRHQVYPSRIAAERVSVSFNYNWITAPGPQPAR